jgi:hypothetical protein
MDRSLLHHRIVRTLAFALIGCGGGGGLKDADANPGSGTAPTPGFADGRDFVLFSNDGWQSLGRSTTDGVQGELMYRSTSKVPIQMADGGKRFLYFQSTPGQDDRVTLYDTRSLKPLSTQTVPANSDILGPVFGDPTAYLVRTFTGTTDNGTAILVDIGKGTALRAIATGGPRETIKALPDGRLYRVNDDSGRIAIAGANGQWVPLGGLQIPAGRRIGTFDISHAGDRIAVDYAFTDNINVVRGDVWVANIDGSNQYRLTNQGEMFTPRWSPDDARIAFQVNNLSTLAGGGNGGAGVSGNCSYWHVPANAQNVSGVATGKAHDVARQILVNADGVKGSRACHVLAWVR